MHGQPPYLGATPGIVDPHLTPEPIGTSGELSPGPDHLRPEVHEERRELERRGYLPEQETTGRAAVQGIGSPHRGDSVEDYGVMDDGDWGEVDLGHIVEPPNAATGEPLSRFVDGPIFE